MLITPWALLHRPFTTLSTVLLLGGDANNNEQIDILDATCIGNDYDKTSGFSNCGDPQGSSDVNGDGIVDILDLVLMGGNYAATSSPWSP